MLRCRAVLQRVHQSPLSCASSNIVNHRNSHQLVYGACRGLSTQVRVPTRESSIEDMKHGGTFDVLVIGGGSTGVGTALDAATRGLKVALVEREDFSSGTSSRSTKLIHGGVRYLEKAFWDADIKQYKLVKEALTERGTWFKIAPHIASWLPIMLPLYQWWKVPYFWVGTKAYDLVAGLPPKRSYFLSRSKALESFPMLQPKGLKGAVVYYDGQMNDSRMNVTLAMTAAAHGAAVANYVSVAQLEKEDGKVVGATMKDELTGETFSVRAKTIVSAVGPFTDSIRKLDKKDNADIVVPASGSHLILPDYYSPRQMGLIDPATSDGRVIFFLPWLGHTIVGTTDSPASPTRTPRPKEEEIKWMLNEVDRYLSGVQVRRSDVLSAWTGIRPLVKDPAAKSTEAIARTHVVHTDAETGLITVAGGKWTTYREMAEDCVNAAVKQGKLRATDCVTKTTQLLGAANWSPNHFIKLIQDFGVDSRVAKHLSSTYGDMAADVIKLCSDTGKRWPQKGTLLVEGYPYLEGEVRFAVKEYARTAVDVLARRTRLAFLNKNAARDALPMVIDIMRKELNWDDARCAAEKQAAKDFFTTIAGPVPFEEEDFIRKQFNKVDVGGDGSIDMTELKKLAIALGEQMTEQELTAAYTEMDSRKTGRIDFGSFLTWWTSDKKGSTGLRLHRGLIHSQNAAASYP